MPLSADGNAVPMIDVIRRGKSGVDAERCADDAADEAGERHEPRAQGHEDEHARDRVQERQRSRVG
jgi:hypothetical protein